MKLPQPLLDARLVRRYKRFLADVELPGGEKVTVHCPNPGRMTGLDAPGSEIVLSRSDDPRRKLAYTWELVRVGRSWVCVHSARANGVVGEALRANRIAELSGYENVRAEVKVGERSRLDFLLEGSKGSCLIEVKSVTLREGAVALFPDSVTVRGTRHLRELATRARSGERAVMFFLVSRGDCRSFRPAAAIDPEYAAALIRAGAAGVEILAYTARIRRDQIHLGRPLPIDLG